jgi:hypothetical protein
MNPQQLKEANAWAQSASQQMEDDKLRDQRQPNDLKTFMEALKPHQTKGHGVNSANTYWLKHVFENHFGHYMTEEDFVEAILALSEGWIVKKNTRSTSIHNPMQKPWVLNVNQKAF